MKQPCPACHNLLTLPEQMSGRPVKCPICGNKFTVPGDLAASAAPPGGDELMLQVPSENAAGASGPKELEFCPNCGAKWPPQGSSCKKCYFNVAVGRKIRLTPRRWIDLRVDTTKVALLLLAGGAVFGIYWLYHNWGEVKKKVDTEYDRASRGEVSSSSQRPFENKTPASANSKTPASSGSQKQPVKATPPPETGPDFQTLPVPERVKTTLANLRLPETYAKGKARAVELAAHTDAQPLLAKALEESIQTGAQATYGFRTALASALATQVNPLLVRTFTLCLSRKGLSEGQFHGMLDIAIPALERAGTYRQAELENALREGPWELKAGVITACGRAGWRQSSDLLRGLLKDPALPVRRATAVALTGDLRSPELVPDLVLALRDEDLSVALFASQALGPLYREAAASLRETYASAAELSLGRALLFARGLLGSREPKDIAVFTERSKHWLPAGALSAEAARKGERLLSAKGDLERIVLLSRLCASGKVEPPGALPYVALSLADPIAGVRRRAASVLQGCPEPQVIEALAYASLDEAPAVRLIAADAPDTKVLPGAAKAIWKSGMEFGGPRRTCCAGALHRFGDAEATALLHGLVADESGPLPERIQALRFLGAAMSAAERKQALTLIMTGRLDTISVMHLQSALSRAGDDEARKALYGYLRSSFSDLEKTAALHEIAIANDARGLPGLLVLLRAGSLTPSVLDELCLVLDRMPSKETFAGLLDALPLSNEATIEPLARTLARYKEEAPKALPAKLQSEVPAVRSVALAALALSGTPEASLLVARHLKTEKNSVVLNTGLRYLSEQQEIPNTLTAAEWEANLSGAKANLSGPWVKVEQTRDGLEYSVPEEMDPKNAAGLRWPGDPAFVVHRDTNNVAPELFNSVKAKLVLKQGIDGGKATVIDLQANGRNPAIPFAGMIWQERGLLKTLYMGRTRGGSGAVLIQVEFSCKAAFWEYNKPLLDKLLASVCLTNAKK